MHESTVLRNPNFPTPRERRYRNMRVSQELFFNLLFTPRLWRGRKPESINLKAGGAMDDWPDTVECVEVDLPKDVVVEAMAFDPIQAQIWLRLWSSEWEPVPLGDMIPEIKPEATMHYRQVLPLPPGRGPCGGILATWQPENPVKEEVRMSEQKFMEKYGSFVTKPSNDPAVENLVKSGPAIVRCPVCHCYPPEHQHWCSNRTQ